MPNKNNLEKYRQALAESFPALEVTQLEYLSEGWDSVVCLVNEKLVFRFPKRPDVERNLKVEIRLLPELAPRLPLAIPRFDYVGQPGQAFPFTFVGYEKIEGESLSGWQAWASGACSKIILKYPFVAREMEVAQWWQPAVGAFLTALHAFPVERARELGAGNTPLTDLTPPGHDWRETLEDFYRLVREKVLDLLSDDLQDKIADTFEDFLDNDRHFEFEPTLIHGDLLDDHVLLDFDNQRITGIIDFGGLSIGDPALDVWESIKDYYGGPLDPTFFHRRRFYLKLLPAFASIFFGLEHSDPALVEYGLSELNFQFDDFWSQPL
jgi:aminoglycoside 2''-phosphotransferase